MVRKFESQKSNINIGIQNFMNVGEVLTIDF